MVAFGWPAADWDAARDDLLRHCCGRDAAHDAAAPRYVPGGVVQRLSSGGPVTGSRDLRYGMLREPADRGRTERGGDR